MVTAICDDCAAAAQELKSNIESICAQKDWPLESAVYTSPAALLQADLSKTQVVFLDIDMPQVNGLEAAAQLRAKFPEIIIVFVTSYIEYAPEGIPRECIQVSSEAALGAGALRCYVRRASKVVRICTDYLYPHKKRDHHPAGEQYPLY